MTILLYKANLDEAEKYTQKCIIPFSVFSYLNIKVGSFVEINCGPINTVCKVFLHSYPRNSIYVDSTISWNKISSEVDKIVFDISQDFTAVQISTIQNIKIKIQFQKEVDSFILSSKQYCNIVLELIKSYVVKKNSVIKCSGKYLADLFNIDNIIVCDIIFDNDLQKMTPTFGRFSKTTDIELVGIVFLKESNLLKKLQNIELGGINDAVEHLSLCIKKCKNILISGPPRCGKSTLLRKFCCDTSCFFLVVDGHSYLTFDKCKLIYSQLTNASKMFPKGHVILFIDDIDQLISVDTKRKKYVLLISDLVGSFKGNNVIIIATTTYRSFLNIDILKLFDTEVSLGIPSQLQRKEQLEILLKDLQNSIDCANIAQKTSGFVAGDIKFLVDEILSFQRRNKNNIGKTVSMKEVDKILESITPSLLKTSEWSLKVKPIYWEDIGGMEDIKKRLQMCIERPLLHPEVFKKVDLPCPRGVLLFGPPGCCKTTIARGLATECKANFFAANPSQIYSPYVGVAEKNISKLFYEARLCSPSIIFLDELDSLVGRRELDSKTIGVGEKVLSTLLTEMDGFGVATAHGGSENSQNILNYCSDTMDDTNERMTEQVIVVAATNRPHCIDDALLRPGRFDVILYVPPPNVDERESILKAYTKDASLLNVNLRNIAEKAEHFSGADLKHLHTMAGHNGLRENENLDYITEKHYMEALKNIQPSITLQQIEMYEQLASKYGTFIPK